MKPERWVNKGQMVRKQTKPERKDEQEENERQRKQVTEANRPRGREWQGQQEQRDGVARTPKERCQEPGQKNREAVHS